MHSTDVYSVKPPIAMLIAMLVIPLLVKILIHICILTLAKLVEWHLTSGLDDLAHITRPMPLNDQSEMLWLFVDFVDQAE